MPKHTPSEKAKNRKESAASNLRRLIPGQMAKDLNKRVTKEIKAAAQKRKAK